VGASDFHIIRRILGQGWRYRAMIVLSLASAGVSGALLAYLLSQLGPFMANLAGSKQAISPAELAASSAGLMAIGLHLLALAPLAAASAYGAWWAGQWVANRTMQDLRSRILGHLVHLDLAYHGELARGDLLTRLTTDLEGVLRIQQYLYGKLFQRPLESLGILAFVGWQDWRLLIALVTVLGAVLLILAPLLRRTRRRSERARETLAANFSLLEQVTAGIRVVKAMGSAEREEQRYAEHNHSLFNANMRVARSRAQSDAITAAAMFAIAGIGIGGGGWLFARGMIDPFTYIFGVAALARLITALREMVRTWGDMQEQRPAAVRVYAVLDRVPAIADRAGARPCPAPRQALRFEDVSFRYPGGEGQGDVLRGITIDIPVGRTVALVGKSGGGKSTMLDLLPRFRDVTGGRITIDGTDLRDLQLASLSQHFAIVQQDNFLFNDTIYANILYGRPGATRAEVEQAARRAHVHEAILALEGGKGYDTVVGDRGGRLSGGQRQRVAIARALLRDAPILLLDEATSALDAESETHVQEALGELMKGRTVVVVAHRLATVQHADRIYVLAGAHARDGADDPRRGTIIESGTHQELVARGGDYAEMVRLQQLGG
jgi:subfamily B ATP-binding cassette protein MsbA